MTTGRMLVEARAQVGSGQVHLPFSLDLAAPSRGSVSPQGGYEVRHEGDSGVVVPTTELSLPSTGASVPVGEV